MTDKFLFTFLDYRLCSLCAVDYLRYLNYFRTTVCDWCFIFYSKLRNWILVNLYSSFLSLLANFLLEISSRNS